MYTQQILNKIEKTSNKTFQEYQSTLLYQINVQDGIKCAGWKIQLNLGILTISNGIGWAKIIPKHKFGQK